MPRAVTTAEVIAAVRALAAAHPHRTVWVGIDGFGAAGKTTLAAALADAEPRVAVVHVDDFAGPGIAEWDWVRFHAAVVAPLRAGRAAHYQVWDWGSDVGGDWVDLPPGRIIVVEGVSSTRTEADVRWDLTIWVTAPDATRLQRARARDGEARMITWLQEWMPSEQAYAARERPSERVDLVVDGGGVG